MIKKFLKNWNSFEICFLIFSSLIISICFLLGSDKNILALIVSLLGITTVICGAKGLVISPFINIIYNIIYIILCFSQNFYGEVLIYIFIMTPINIFTIISWLKNRSNENKDIVKVNKIETDDNTTEYYSPIGVTELSDGNLISPAVYLSRDSSQEYFYSESPAVMLFSENGEELVRNNFFRPGYCISNSLQHVFVKEDNVKTIFSYNK